MNAPATPDAARAAPAAEQGPALRVDGGATPEEVVAVVVALAALADPAPAAPAGTTVSLWSARRWAALAGTAAPGPDAWRTSTWPR